MEFDSEKIKNYSENFLKIATISGGLFYVTGLVITTFYYSKFNISSVDLISPVHILTGLEFWVFFLLASIFTEITLPIINKEGLHNFTTYFFLWLSFGIAYIALTQGGGEKIYLTLLLFIGFSTVILILTAYYGKIIKSFEGRKRIIGTTIFFVLASYWLLQTYALYIYPNVYTAWGGGKSHKLSLIIKHSVSYKSLEHILSFKDSLNIETKEYVLIKETNDDFYILKDSSQEIIQIPKRETDGIILH